MKKHFYPLIASCFLFSSSLMAMTLDDNPFKKGSMMTLRLERSSQPGNPVFRSNDDALKEVVAISVEKSPYMDRVTHCSSEGIAAALRRNPLVKAFDLPEGVLTDLTGLFRLDNFVDQIKILRIGGIHQFLNAEEWEALSCTILEHLILNRVPFQQQVLAVTLPRTLRVLDLDTTGGRQAEMILTDLENCEGLRELRLRGGATSGDVLGNDSLFNLDTILPYFDKFPQTLQRIEIEQTGLKSVQQITDFFKAVHKKSKITEPLPHLQRFTIRDPNTQASFTYQKKSEESFMCFQGFDALGDVREGLRYTDHFFHHPASVELENIGMAFSLGEGFTAKQLQGRVKITNCAPYSETLTLPRAAAPVVRAEQKCGGASPVTLFDIKIFVGNSQTKEILNCLYVREYQTKEKLMEAVMQNPQWLFTFTELLQTPDCAGIAGNLSLDAKSRHALLLKSLNSPSSEVLQFPSVTAVAAAEDACSSLVSAMNLPAFQNTPTAFLPDLPAVKIDSVMIRPGNTITAEVLKNIVDNGIKTKDALIHAIIEIPVILFSVAELAEYPDCAGKKGSLSEVAQKRSDALLLWFSNPNASSSGPLQFDALEQKVDNGAEGGLVQHQLADLSLD